MYSTKKKILVPDQMEYAKAIEGLGAVTGDTADFYSNPDKYSLVLFTGGSDVSPELYGDSSPLGVCRCNKHRDQADIKLFGHATKHGIKMAGICRGAQLLNVMGGGRLIHDLTGHNTMKEHVFRPTCEDYTYIKVNSLHHQMMIPPPDGYVIGTSPYRLSDNYIGYNDQPVKWPGPEIEAVLIPKIKSVGVQYHPEMMDKNSAGYQFFYEMIKHFLEMDESYFVKRYTGAKEVSHVK